MTARQLITVLLLRSIVVLVTFRADLASALTAAEIMQRNPDSIVYLVKKAENQPGIIRQGTGFIVSERGHVLTAKHLLPEQPGEMLIAVIGEKDGISLPLQPIVTSSNADVALLQLPQPKANKKYHPVPVRDSSSVKVGETLAIVGFPLNSGITPQDAKIINLYGPDGDFVVDAMIDVGDSGAPVFDEQGRVIGLVEGGHPAWPSSNVVIPIDFANPLLSQIGVSPTTLSAPWRGRNYALVKDQTLASYVQDMHAYPVFTLRDLNSGDLLTEEEYGEYFIQTPRSQCFRKPPGPPDQEWQADKLPMPRTLTQSDLLNVLAEPRPLAEAAKGAGFREKFQLGFRFAEVIVDEPPGSVFSDYICPKDCSSVIVRKAIKGRNELSLTFDPSDSSADPERLKANVEHVLQVSTYAPPAPPYMLTLANADPLPVGFRPLNICNRNNIAADIGGGLGKKVSNALQSFSDVAKVQTSLARSGELMARLGFPPMQALAGPPERFDDIPDEERDRYLRYVGNLALAYQLIKRNWSIPTGNYADYRYSGLDQINSKNVSDLRPVWMFSTGVLGGHEGGPLIIGDVMYVHTPFPNNVFALDLNDNGHILWKFEPKQDTESVLARLGYNASNRGVAYGGGGQESYGGRGAGRGYIILAQADATVAAVDAEAGKTVWQNKSGDPKLGETMISAPMIVKDKVLVGISGGDFGVRGRMMAYDLNTGKSLWRVYSVGPDGDIGFDAATTSLGRPVGSDSSRNTWEGDQWRVGGGTTSGWLSYDPQLNLVYYGSGTPGVWNAFQRPGDNKWSNTIFARNPDTGVAKWVYQMTPHDEWHFDGSNEMILADIPVRGKMTKALVHFDSNGFAYTLNRETGELLVAEKFEESVNWARAIDLASGRPEINPDYSPQAHGEEQDTKGICPGVQGAKGPQPASFSPSTRLFYVPISRLCMDYRPVKARYVPGSPYKGALVSLESLPGQTGRGGIVAWDAGYGKAVWKKDEPLPVRSGVLATAGGIVLYGTLEGYLKVLDARSGEELYRFKTPSGIIGNVTAYEHDGKQYIAVLSGVSRWDGAAAGPTDDLERQGRNGYNDFSMDTQLGGVLTVFALPD